MQIKTLLLYTPRLEAQVTFYQQRLGLCLHESTDSRAVFQIGRSTLVWEHRSDATPYHFAINIPPYQEKDGLAWLKERLDILTYEENEIQDFSAWNAKAVYFYDADHNIVELIARRDLKQPPVRPFGAHAFLEVSEIGMPLQAIEPVFQQLSQKTGIPIYSGSLNRFCAIGDEQGLFICIDHHKTTWFPTDDPTPASAFELTFVEKGLPFDLSFEDGMIQSLSASR